MRSKPVETIDRVAIRFTGDSGDGMKLTGSLFTPKVLIYQST